MLGVFICIERERGRETVKERERYIYKYTHAHRQYKQIDRKGETYRDRERLDTDTRIFRARACTYSHLYTIKDTLTPTCVCVIA
jgi:hypothetical protein